MGSTSVDAQQPTAPTTSQSIQDWSAALPAVYQAQLQYAPQEAQQQVELAQQYALPLAQAYQKAQSSLYPATSALQEQLAQKASGGMSSQVPDWMKAQYQSGLNAQLGTNVNSPIGADYMSRGLLQQQQDWSRYYDSLGLSATGRQPLTQATTPQTSNYLQGFTPNAVMAGNNQNYSTSGNIYGSQLGYNSAANSAMLNLIGSGIGAGGAALGGF